MTEPTVAVGGSGIRVRIGPVPVSPEAGLRAAILHPAHRVVGPGAGRGRGAPAKTDPVAVAPTPREENSRQVILGSPVNASRRISPGVAIRSVATQKLVMVAAIAARRPADLGVPIAPLVPGIAQEIVAGRG